MGKTTHTVTRFDVDDVYYVEVERTDKYNDELLVDFWLCKDGCGIKNYMFGAKAINCPEEEWEDLIMRNIVDYIDLFETDMKKLQDEYEDGPMLVFSAIERHNHYVDKMKDLAEALVKQYPDIDETPVNAAFCNAWGAMVEGAITLCCEGNIFYKDLHTTEDWRIVQD